MKATFCRMCQSKNLKQWLDLGLHPHSDHFHKEKEAEMFYPLGVSLCEDCGLNQLTYIVAKEELYLKDYLYEASITKTADTHWKEFAESSVKKLGIEKDSLIVDIGSNDGSLLLKYKDEGMQVMGFDPTPEATQLAIDRGVPTVQEFFTWRNAIDNFKENTVDLVVGTNVFAHVDDLNDFIEGVKSILKINGVFIFESPYFGEFLKGVEMDTVYHQHLSYLSLKPLVKFLNKHGMEAFDVEQHELHGGGFRVYIARKGQRKVEKSVEKMLEGETWVFSDLLEVAKKFDKQMDILLGTVLEYKRFDRKVAVVSTPAKGNTLINYSGIGRHISLATDKSKLKQGRYTPGANILVCSDEELAKQQPDVAIILAWNFFDEIVKNIREAGFKGDIIRPLPTVKLVRNKL